MWTTATERRARALRSKRHVRLRTFVCLLLLLAGGIANPVAAAEGKVYRCERDGSVVYTDIGCSLLPPVRLGRPVGTVDPLTEGERALLEHMRQGSAGAHGRARKGESARTRSRTRASANAKAARCAADRSAEQACVDREPPARRPRAKGGKPRRIVSAPAPARASSLFARPRTGGASGPPAERSAGDVRRVAPGRVTSP